MIESLHLVNFEMHKDSLIKFCPGITVIKGGTDQGKSSVRRALSYVVFSKPVQGRPNDKTKDSHVTLRCPGIPAITRGRTGGKKGKNYYRIGTKEISGEETDSLVAIKRTVPEEISQMIDLSEVNIQEQFKEYYLLQSTAGQVAKTLHKLLGMDMVDKTAKVTNSAINAQSRLLKSRKTQIEHIETDIKKYAYVEELGDELDDLEIAIQGYEELEAKTYNLVTTLERFRILQQRMAANKIPQIVEDGARSLRAEILELNEHQKEINKLQQAINATEKVSQRQRDLKEWLHVENEAIELQRDITEFQTQEIKTQQLTDMIDQLQENQNQITNIQGVIRYNTKELAALKKKIKICPVCKTPFKREK